MLDVGFGTIHVREDGPTDGMALLLVHGFDASMHWFDKLTPLLTDSYRVIRIDLVGYGCTGGDRAPDGPAQGSVVAAVLDALDVTDVTALGHSFGCDVVLSVAEQSSRVSRLVLVGQAPDYSYANFPVGQALLTLPLVGDVMHRLAWPAATEYFGRIAFAPGFVIDAGLDANRMFNDHRAMAAAAAHTVLVERKKRLAQRPLDVQLREIGLPTLAVHGRSDQMYDCATTLARYAAAGAEVEVIEGAGHSPNVEQPELLARAVRAFVKRNS
ncbi:alpha/beta fold hydrolase [Nocardia salmonicida]|uniref:alpha/beta fold hydrolase n=1 Tax=Nocardia salmonicida TaxID=53431 RepID=UPI003721CC41